MADAPALTRAQIEHIARLARLRLDSADIERYRQQLTAILDHMALLNELDVEGVEPMTHPALDDAPEQRLAADDGQPPLPLDTLARIAPAMEGRFVAVPKVLGEGATTEGA